MVMPSLWVTSGEAPAKERFANVHYRKAFLLSSSGKTRLGQGWNNKAKLTMRKSYGFRTFRTLELALYHSLGKLPEPESTHEFF
jgi:hypothetical protein